MAAILDLIATAKSRVVDALACCSVSPPHEADKRDVVERKSRSIQSATTELFSRANTNVFSTFSPPEEGDLLITSKTSADLLLLAESTLHSYDYRFLTRQF
jgi:hypothetical protein